MRVSDDSSNSIGGKKIPVSLYLSAINHHSFLRTDKVDNCESKRCHQEDPTRKRNVIPEIISTRFRARECWNAVRLWTLRQLDLRDHY